MAAREAGPLRLGLVGTGIAHSLSPALHTKALELADLSGSYRLFDCADGAAAAAVLDALRRGELDGVNVTTPFKALAAHAADTWLHTGQQRAELRQPVSANTLFMQQTRLVAASTDGYGLTAALLGAQVDLLGKRVLLLGAGGAGQAVAAEILALGARQLRVANRTPQPAATLVAALQVQWPRQAIAQAWGEARGLAGVDVVVHATRLGHGQPASAAVLADLATQLDWLPWAAWRSSRPLLADLVYAAGLTPLQSLSVSRGLPLDDRLGEPPIVAPRIHAALREPHGILQYFGQAMLAHQAARSFLLWTGRRVNAQQMLAAILPRPTSTNCT